MSDPQLPAAIGPSVLRAISATTTDAIIVADADGKIVSFNRAAETILGYSSEEVLGKPLTVLMPERHRAAHSAGLARLRETGEARIAGKVVEIEALRQDGEEVPIELTVSILRDDGRSLFLGIARDVTRRRQAEDALRHSEESFRQLVERSPEPLLVYRAGFLLYVNDALVRLLGHRTKDDLVGRFLEELLDEVDRKRAAEWLAELTERGEGPSSQVLRAAARDGRVVEIDCRAVAIDFHGVPAVVLLARDVTEQRAVEAERRKLMTFLDSIVENIPNMIFVKEAGELRFERFNRAGEELLGVPRTELIGKNDYDFFPREQADFFQARDRETLRGENVLDIPEEPIDTSTGQRWLHTRKIPIKDETGRPLYLLGISEDITERRQHLAELEEAQRATQLLNRELEAFSYSVAHDLRAPLRAMDGFSLALLEEYGDRLDEQGRQYLDRVRKGSQRMAQLIEDLLTLAKVARSAFERSSVDVSARAEEIVQSMQAADPGRDVQVSIEPGLQADADAVLLGVVLENLLANAWKFTAHASAARIEVGRTETQHGSALFVRDNGAGFDMAHAAKLFGAFQRLHASSEYAGTGVGLAIVSRIVDRHGGRIWAEARPNEGATFYFTLEGGTS